MPGHVIIASFLTAARPPQPLMPNPSPLIGLPAGDIHLWLCPLDNAGHPATAAAFRALLTPDELSIEARFHFAADRYRYLLTRTLVRSVLSRYAPLHPSGWRFAANPFGRPCLQTPIGKECQGLDFNLSHTGGLIVLAIARNIDIGVDVEQIGCTEVLDVDLFLSPVEATAWNALPPNQRTERFFELWTLKESYIKARGVGLQIPLDSFSFTLDDSSSIEFSLMQPSADLAQRWRFWQLRPSFEHVIALCAAPDSSIATRIVCREIAPMQWERPLEIRTTRSSHPALVKTGPLPD